MTNFAIRRNIKVKLKTSNHINYTYLSVKLFIEKEKKRVFNSLKYGLKYYLKFGLSWKLAYYYICGNSAMVPQVLFALSSLTATRSWELIIDSNYAHPLLFSWDILEFRVKYLIRDCSFGL